MYTAKQLNDDKKRQSVIDVLKKMADANHKQTVIDNLEAGGLDVRTALRVIADDIKPKRYLEIGVGMGWSMAQLLDECPDCDCVGLDQWIKDYAGWTLDSHAVADNLFQFGAPLFVPGDSRKKLPTLDGKFDFIFVDGGRTTEVARFDLAHSARLLNDGGVLVFDDLIDGTEGGNATMLEVWAEFKEAYSDWEFGEFTESLTPFGIAIKPAAKAKKADTLSEEKSAATSSTSTKKKSTTRK